MVHTPVIMAVVQAALAVSVANSSLGGSFSVLTFSKNGTCMSTANNSCRYLTDMLLLHHKPSVSLPPDETAPTFICMQ